MLAKQTGFFTINQVNNSTIYENMPHQTKNHELGLTSERKKKKESISTKEMILQNGLSGNSKRFKRAIVPTKPSFIFHREIFILFNQLCYPCVDPADLSVGADMPRMNHLDHEPDQRTAAQKKRPVSLVSQAPLFLMKPSHRGSDAPPRGVCFLHLIPLLNPKMNQGRLPNNRRDRFPLRLWLPLTIQTRVRLHIRLRIRLWLRLCRFSSSGREPHPNLHPVLFHRLSRAKR